MKRVLSLIADKLGLLPYLHVFREKLFPTEYYKAAQRGIIKYIDFYHQFIDKGDLCFDIGANRGHRTEVFLRLGGRVVAVEPQKSCASYLKVKYNRKIVLEEIALGSRVESSIMYICEDTTLSTLSKEWTQKASKRFRTLNWNKKQEIQVSTLDSLIEKYGTPKFCKIDVEGYELEVLKGLSSSIPFISFEYMTPDNDEITLACIDYLYSINNNLMLNYSSGDSMILDLKYWKEYDKFIEILKSDAFLKSGWGDIYIQMTIN